MWLLQRHLVVGVYFIEQLFNQQNLAEIKNVSWVESGSSTVKGYKQTTRSQTTTQFPPEIESR